MTEDREIFIQYLFYGIFDWNYFANVCISIPCTITAPKRLKETEGRLI